MAKRQLQPAPTESTQRAQCRHCLELINVGARICPHCGQFQKRWSNAFQFANAISMMFLLVSIVQLALTSLKLAEAVEANKKAELALEKVQQAEQRVIAAQRDIVDVAGAVIQIAAILPHATGYGAGLTDSTRSILKHQSEYLNKKIIQFRQDSGH